MTAISDNTPGPPGPSPPSQPHDLAATRAASKRFGDDVEGLKLRMQAVEDQLNSNAGSVMAGPSREEIDAKLEAAEARSETRVTHLDGKLDLLTSKLDMLVGAVAAGRVESASNRNAILGALLGAVLALGALVIAMATYGDAIFSRGMQVRDLASSIVKDTLERQAASKPDAPAVQKQ